jgi:hypothetical protein
MTYHNKEKYIIQGDNIILETTTKQIVLNTRLQDVVFDPTNRFSIDSSLKMNPITSLSQDNSIRYFDSNEILYKVSNIGQKISFNSHGTLASNNRWTPSFSSQSTDPLWKWVIKSRFSTTPGSNTGILRTSFILIEMYKKDSGQIHLMNGKLLYAEVDDKDSTIIHTFAPPFPNVYENGLICLGSLIETDDSKLDLQNPKVMTAKIMSDGWNQDLYRPQYNWVEKGELTQEFTLPTNLKDSKITHGFLRTTDKNDLTLVTPMLHTNILNVFGDQY